MSASPCSICSMIILTRRLEGARLKLGSNFPKPSQNWGVTDKLVWWRPSGKLSHSQHRGPQDGRALSGPSSIWVETRKPDQQRFGGYAPCTSQAPTLQGCTNFWSSKIWAANCKLARERNSPNSFLGAKIAPIARYISCNKDMHRQKLQKKEHSIKTKKCKPDLGWNLKFGC